METEQQLNSDTITISGEEPMWTTVWIETGSFITPIMLTTPIIDPENYIKPALGSGSRSILAFLTYT